MSLTSWAQNIIDAHEARSGAGRIFIGKSRKGGEDKPLALKISERRIYEMQTLIEALLEGPGIAVEKRALVRIFDELNIAVAHARKDEERRYLLQKHGLKPDSFPPARSTQD